MGRRIRKSGRQAKRRRSTAGSKVHKTSAGVADLREHLDRCTRELDDALQQQMATSEVLSIIRQSPANAQPVFDAIVKSATRLCGAIFGVVYLCDEDRLRIVATNNFTPSATTHLNQLQQQKRPERSHLGGRAILDRKVVHVPDVLEDPEYSHELALAGGWRAVLAVPLLREGIPIGALTAAKAEAAPFSDRQIQLLKTFADQAVIAIENTRVLNELRESLQQQTATADVLKVISSSPGNLEPVFDAILASATQICQAKFGTLNLFENNAFRSVALHNPPPQFRMRLGQIIHPHPDSGLAHVARTKQISHIEDIRTQKPYRAGNQAVVELADLAGARTLLSVPMLKEDELVGSMSIYRQEVRPFSEKQIELIKNFAAQAVIAIENTRLLNELRQRTDDLTESLEQQTATAEILQTINRSPGDVAPVFDAMVESAMHFCQADYGHVYSYDGEFFDLIAAHGEPRYLDWIKQTGPRLPENSLTLERVISGAPFVHIADIAEDDTYRSGNPRARTIVDKFDIHTLLTVALRKEDKLLGSFVLYRRVARPFSEKQVALVQNFATQAVIAMENARLLTELRQRTDDLTELLEQQTATSEVLRIISSSPGELESVFNSMLDNAVRICGARFGNLALYENGTMRLAAMHNAPLEFEKLRREIPSFR